ncbi:MAG TPA: MFS transporter [Pseudonocardiaceae bacterium]|nr:MFS transporter [Pseudonocardiaceae bacterium]
MNMAFTALVGRALRAAASDITPLRESVAFRRLFAGQTVSQVGTQVTRVAVPLQVYAITRSSLDVGLIGAAGFVPLVIFGLYGGSIADAVDRRKLVLLTSTGTMLVSAVLLEQAMLGINRVSVLFGCVAVQSAFAAVDSPARRAIIPQLVRVEKLPAANTLSYGSMQLTVIAGPVLAGVSVGAGGFGWAYAIDVASFAGAFYAAVRLPSLPPGTGAQRAGLRSVVEGLRFLAARRVVSMTFVADLIAMIFGSPTALFPALADGQYGGGASTAGLLYAAPAVGAVVATLLGGAIARVHRHGLGVVVSIAMWGVAITLFGLASTLWLGLLMLAVAGAADTVSAVYRSTILQVATPAGMQGRLQGVFIVVVTGGPRLGDLEAGAVASAFTPQISVVSGGLACLAGIGLLALVVPAFVRYDARSARWNAQDHSSGRASHRNRDDA